MFREGRKDTRCVESRNFGGPLDGFLNEGRHHIRPTRVLIQDHSWRQVRTAKGKHNGDLRNNGFPIKE